MASTKEYLNFVLEQLSEIEDVSFRPMMGEYVVYYQGKVIGGVYDNRFLVKPTASALAAMPNATLEIPYPGAKGMLLVDELDDRQFLKKLLESMVLELPEKRK